MFFTKLKRNKILWDAIWRYENRSIRPQHLSACTSWRVSTRHDLTKLVGLCLVKKLDLTHLPPFVTSTSPAACRFLFIYLCLLLTLSIIYTVYRQMMIPRVNLKIAFGWFRGKCQTSVYEASFHLQTTIYDAQSQDDDRGNASGDVIITSSEAMMVEEEQAGEHT